MQRLSEQRFQEELNRILEGLRQYQPQKVILFGSFARGDHHALSDIDLLIIKRTDRPFIERLSMNRNLQEAHRWLAQARHYIPTRYPNGLPGGIPHEVYTQDQARDAIASARQVLEQVERRIPPHKEGAL